MRDIILLCVVALFLWLGYRFMKKVDAFFYDIEKNSAAVSDTLILRIGFEHVEDIGLMDGIIEKISKDHIKSNIHFFYGTYEEIEQYIRDGKVDLGCVEIRSGDSKNADKEFGSDLIKLYRRMIQYKQLEIPLEPLGEKWIERRIIWNKDYFNKEISTVIKYLTV